MTAQLGISTKTLYYVIKGLCQSNGIYIYFIYTENILGYNKSFYLKVSLYVRRKYKHKQ